MPLGERCLGRVNHLLGPLDLGHELRHVREDVERRIEQHRSVDPLRMAGGELEDEPAAERVADPVRPPEAEGVDGLDDVGDVCLECPGRLPAGPSVPAQVWRDDVEARGPTLLGQLLETLAVRGDAVQADDRGGVRISPLVHVQAHGATILAPCRST